MHDAVSSFTAVSSDQGNLQMERVPLNDIANQFGTPCYVYSKAAISQ